MRDKCLLAASERAIQATSLPAYVVFTHSMPMCLFCRHTLNAPGSAWCGSVKDTIYHCKIEAHAGNSVTSVLMPQQFSQPVPWNHAELRFSYCFCSFTAQQICKYAQKTIPMPPVRGRLLYTHNLTNCTLNVELFGVCFTLLCMYLQYDVSLSCNRCNLRTAIYQMKM